MNKILIISPSDAAGQLLQVAKGTVLIIRPGPESLAPQVDIKTNYPANKNKFDRQKYYSLPILTDHQDSISSSLNWHASLQLDQAGTFHFKWSAANWEAIVVVEPKIKYPLDGLKCQTIISKNLGPFKEWRQRLAVTKELGYNLIHFTPIQELGGSNSAYSLKNQHKINPNFKTTLDEIKKEIEFMEKKWGILSVADIVVNHTADDSPWIHEHPECAYNMVNSPHLRPAFLLDSAFIWLAKDIASGYLIETDQLGPTITSEKDLQTIRVLLKTFYVPQLKIYEYFMIDIGTAVANVNQIARGDFQVTYNYGRNTARVSRCPGEPGLAELLASENLRKRKEINGLLDYAIENAISAMRYERLNNGPFHGKPLDPNQPLVAPYFNHTPWETFNVATEERLMLNKGYQFMAHNGWVMGCAPNFDFAAPDSQTYLKRELCAWGDCIKLRYSSEAPYLWEHMRKYIEAQAKVFHGFRLDNCHSTPMEAAEFVVDVARSVRPDIYIMAELFTSSEAMDNQFVNRLGITSLVRESMSAHNAHELGRLIYRFGGTPVGAFHQHGSDLLKPGVAHAIFFDQTHDNESPIVKRCAFDVPATAALINMASCATGSNRGYDELVPHHISVVSETRLYQEKVDPKSGILPLRRLINGLLQRELLQGFTEIFVDQVNAHVIAITRHNPTDGRSIVLVARTAFSRDSSMNDCHIKFQGHVAQILFETQAYGDPEMHVRNEKFINGLEKFMIRTHNTQAAPSESKLAEIINHGDEAEIRLQEFKFLPSCVLAVEIHLSKRQEEALNFLNSWNVGNITSLSLEDANYILFRCPSECEEPYEVPNFGKFTYAGLYGLMYHLVKVRQNQDQAHPLAENLRNGSWLANYILARLHSRPTTALVAQQLEVALNQIDVLPRGMRPKYFDIVITQLYQAVVDLVYSRMGHFIQRGPELVRLLALSSVALIGDCPSAPMPTSGTPSLAAGLPHFASGYMRNWGRDTFIAFRGLLLVTGRFSEAKSIIVAYAQTLKHGLIPNLLDGGKNSRYNCRDAVWWWLYSIREYTKIIPKGTDILHQVVERIHKPEIGKRKKELLRDVMQEALELHFRGTEFKDEGLDEHMREEGFQVSIAIDRETGFPQGGNRYNCGTWMDKMGSSAKANTKGLPATPRDGSAVELVGLCWAVVSWLDELSKTREIYPYDGVKCLYDNTIELKWSWKKWSQLIMANFEPTFYVGADNDSTFVNRRGIYKDSVGSSIEWQDYQLRPNFLIAMVVAPELFNKEHAQSAIKMAKEHLCGPLGIKTLDPSDFWYRGDYDNGLDTTDEKVAHGYNYHSGPEWLWLTGYYIRASSKFLGQSERQHHLKILSNFHATLQSTPWFGLPELTNSEGKFCKDSCPIQAWSLGTALEALYESVRN